MILNNYAIGVKSIKWVALLVIIGFEEIDFGFLFSHYVVFAEVNARGSRVYRAAMIFVIALLLQHINPRHLLILPIRINRIYLLICGFNPGSYKTVLTG